ncbi:extensin-like domain-containing protein [Azohydromonas lata]|uniref:extensin-like domain-containing protein n=1 Tax=Azohydromonas lata TaxID=45677 RepID=UPI00082F655D|nr:extensin family protein [Azohydromonas lata]
MADFLRLAVLLLVLLALPSPQGRGGIPERWLPWAPLRIADKPNLLTPFKLSRLGRDAALCRAVLDEAPQLQATPVPDREVGQGCRLTDAVRVTRTAFALETPFLLSCRGAVALALWETHVVQPAAQELLGAPVARMQHLGSLACRDVAGRAGRRSRHAQADALDVAGFTLADGRRVSVLRDWRDAKSPAGSFLREVHRGGCRSFNGVLGPDYNAAHADHLHLEMGGGRFCR